MEKKENKFKTTAKKVWSFVKEHKKAIAIGAVSGAGVCLGAGFVAWLKHQENLSEELAVEIDPQKEHAIYNVWKDSDTVSVLIGGDGLLEANQLADPLELIYGNYGIDEHTPVSAMIEFDISNKD